MEIICSTCNKTKNLNSRSIRKNLKRNGIYRCQKCYFKTLEGSGNPNNKHDTKNNLFSDVDKITSESAYLLGWIASDGSLNENGTIAIEISEKDEMILYQLREIVFGQNKPEIKKTKLGKQRILRINSKTMVKDICKLLQTKAGKKSHTVRMPKLQNNILRDFIRGYFDGDGYVGLHQNIPKASIYSNSDLMLQDIINWSIKMGFKAAKYKSVIEWTGLHAIDLLSHLYDDSNLNLFRKKDKYLDICLWKPSLQGYYKKRDGILFNKTRKDAVYPFKSRASDSGYDLTLLEKVKSFGDSKSDFGVVELYDTGIKIMPPEGYYFDMVPRSSIIKSGYILANSIGVIDRSYRGSILVPLIKINSKAKDLELPQRLVQIVPREIVHFDLEEVCSEEELENTNRSSDGFGSTGKK